MPSPIDNVMLTAADLGFEHVAAAAAQDVQPPAALLLDAPVVDGLGRPSLESSFSPVDRLASLTLSKDTNNVWAQNLSGAREILGASVLRPLRDDSNNSWIHEFPDTWTDEEPSLCAASSPQSSVLSASDSDSELQPFFTPPSTPDLDQFHAFTPLYPPASGDLRGADPFTFYTAVPESDKSPVPEALRGFDDPLMSSTPELNPSIRVPVGCFATVPFTPTTVMPSQVIFAPPISPSGNAGSSAGKRNRRVRFDVPNSRGPKADAKNSRMNRTPFVQFHAPKPDGPTQEQILAAKALKEGRLGIFKMPPRSRKFKTADCNGLRAPWSDIRPNPILMDRQIQIVSFADNNKALVKTIDLPSEELSGARKRAATRKAVQRAQPPRRLRGRPPKTCRRRRTSEEID